jgi:hypothetical protein
VKIEIYWSKPVKKKVIFVSFQLSKKDEMAKISTLNNRMPLRFVNMTKKAP